MRSKTLGGGRAATSINPSLPSVRVIPPVVSQDDDDAAVPKTSVETNHDVPDVREVGLKGIMDNSMNEGSKRNPHENFDHDYILDRKICISCNEGGEVLVCSERGCPVTVHAKCIHCEPKFDGMGNFYCSYCWFKRALAEVQKVRNKALIAKKYLSEFLDNNVNTSNQLAQKDGQAKRKEPKESSLMGNRTCLDYSNRQGNGSVHSQPLQRVKDQQKVMEVVTASADQHGIGVEDEAQANAGDSIHCRKEKSPVHTVLVDKSMNRENLDIHNITEIHETIFLEGKEGMKPEDPRYNGENVHEGIVEDGEEAELLSASDLGTYTDGHSPDIASVKQTQKSTAVSVDNKDTMQGRVKLLQNESKMPATSSSVSETIDSDSEPEAPLVKKRRVKQKAQKHLQRVSSVRKSLSSNRNVEGENACSENEEVTSSKTLRQARVSPKPGKQLTLPTGKRKRLNWTTEEENMLKEGVSKFSEEKRNIPWRKILEFGCHVFDNTRNPADLKDKWRNIMAYKG